MKNSRREFIKSSVAVTAVGIGAAKFGMLRATLAAARMQGKQPLNERNLNSIIPKDPNEYANWIKGPSGDLKAWVREKFQLTADQDKALNSLTTTQINKVKDALRQAAAKKAKLSIAFATGIVVTKDLDFTSNVAVRSASRETSGSTTSGGTSGGSSGGSSGATTGATKVDVGVKFGPVSVEVKICCKCQG